MKPLGDELEHYWMMTDMAAATKAGLVAAYQDGRMTHDDWADMVLRCRSCTWASGCREWLKRNEAADVPPTLCANRDQLVQLREGNL